jgi:hypothetical protein
MKSCSNLCWESFSLCFHRHLAYRVKYRKSFEHANYVIRILATNSMAGELIFRFVCTLRCNTSVELLFAKLEVV